MASSPFPWIFRYEDEGRTQGTEFLRKPLLRPVVVVRALGTHLGSQNVQALVDSGADHVLAAPWIAQDIGVTPDASRELMVQIGGAHRKVRFADVAIQLLPPEFSVSEGGYDPGSVFEWYTQVGFFLEWNNPPWSMVLGQIGFFDRFTITFNRESQALAVTHLEDFDARYPQPPADDPNGRPLRQF